MRRFPVASGCSFTVSLVLSFAFVRAHKRTAERLEKAHSDSTYSTRSSPEFPLGVSSSNRRQRVKNTKPTLRPLWRTFRFLDQLPMIWIRLHTKQDEAVTSWVRWLANGIFSQALLKRQNELSEMQIVTVINPGVSRWTPLHLGALFALRWEFGWG